MSDKERTLKQLYNDAKQAEEQLKYLNPRTDEYKDALQSAIHSYEECKDLIRQMALFSANEDLDDIGTTDLKFLAVDSLLAELLLKSYGDDRIDQLRQASALLESYLRQLDHYDLLSPSDRKLYERYRQTRTSFSIIAASDAEQRRNQKVARFQHEKDLKNRLKVLKDQSLAANVDEEVIRSLNLSELEMFVHQAFHSLDMVSQEISMLSQIRQSEPTTSYGADNDPRHRQGDRDGYSERLDGTVTMAGLGRRGGPLLNSSGKPLQPFTLTDKRTQLREGVFRAGHNLPTMSIDEYLEEEKRRGGIIEGGGNNSGAQPEPDEDNLEAVDAATMKARQWDEFVEANPKGAGNTLNRG